MKKKNLPRHILQTDTESNDTSGSDCTLKTGMSPTEKPFEPPNKEKAVTKMEENKHLQKICLLFFWL